MVRVAMIGLGFGAEFIPIYQRHPQAELAAICRRDRAGLDEVGDQFGIAKRYTDYGELLADPDIDSVHINSPIPDHAWMTLEALKAGKHVMCTVPMATTIEDCRQIVDAVERTGLKYMMAETVVYAREFLFIKELYDKGELGKIQFLQASHMQDMDGWPDYWPGLLPMHYATHCVGPMLGLIDASAGDRLLLRLGHDPRGPDRAVRLAVRRRDRHIKIQDTDVTARICRFLFDVARQYRESFDVYGTKKAFEWTLVEGEQHVLHTAKRPEPEIPAEIDVPDFAHLLPEEIQRFTTKGVYDDEETHLSFIQGGGHGGSHPHLVHEFVSALAEARDPCPNARRSANWTCVGLCAHESALKGGEIVRLPEFTLAPRDRRRK